MTQGAMRKGTAMITGTLMIMGTAMIMGITGIVMATARVTSRAHSRMTRHIRSGERANLATEAMWKTDHELTLCIAPTPLGDRICRQIRRTGCDRDQTLRWTKRTNGCPKN